MPKLRNKLTGVVVDVDDATATRLGGGFEPVEQPQSKPDPKPAPKRRAPARKKQ
jgi:hypothetical protein